MEMNGIPFARCSQTADVNKNKVRMAPNFRGGNHNQISLKAHDSFVKFGGPKDPDEAQGVEDAVAFMTRAAAKGKFEQENAKKNPTNDDTKRRQIWNTVKKEYKTANPVNSGLTLDTDSDPEN